MAPEMDRVRNPLATHHFAAQEATNLSLNTDVPPSAASRAQRAAG